MSESSKQHRYPLTIIHLPIKEATREQVLKSPQWLDVLDAIVNLPNWRLLLTSKEVGSSKIVVFVGWKADTNHPALFLLQDETLDALLSPIYEFCGSDKPQIINLYRVAKAMGCYTLRVEQWGRESRIMEVLTVRGPSELVEQTTAEIEEALDGYIRRRYNTRRWGDHGYRRNTLSNMGPCVFKQVDGTTAGDEQGDGDQVTITLFILWSDLRGRSEFQNPEIEDVAVPASSRTYLPRDFWETRVAAKLRALKEKGASITSWDYELSEVGVDRNGKVTTLRKDKIW